MINIALIGYGYWGANYVRAFNELPDVKVTLICDTNEDRLRLARERYPLLGTSANPEEALNNKWIDAVVVATPARAHFEFTQQALLKGKHVLVEKPMTTRVADGEELIRTAEQQGRVLMVGHTFLFNAGVRKVKELISAADFGKVYYLHATRTNLGPVRHDVNALWDLAAHDIAIFDHLLNAMPQWVSAVGQRVLGNPREDVAFVSLHYPGEVLANLHVSWVDPNKVREIVVVGSQRRIVFDDLNNLERVRIFEKGVTPSQVETDSYGEFRLLVRDGDILSPRIETSEPLKNQAMHFCDCIRKGQAPLSDGRNGLAVVRVLAAIDQSLAKNGAPVEIR